MFEGTADGAGAEAGAATGALAAADVDTPQVSVAQFCVGTTSDVI